MAAGVLSLLALATSIWALEPAEARRLVATEAPETIAAVERAPQRFALLLAAVLQQDPILVRLVDAEHPVSPSEPPPDLVSLDGLVNTSRAGLRIHRAVVPPLLSLVAAARRDGVELVVASAWRSLEDQRRLFTTYTRQYGERAASRFSARPGASQHHLGTAVDFAPVGPSFARTPAARWLFDNAHRFGFSLSYPEGLEHETGFLFEPWHWRYLGVEATALQREFFQNQQHRFLRWLNRHRPQLEETLLNRAS